MFGFVTTTVVLVFVAGVAVGWTFPQPEWVKTLWNKVFG